MKKDLIFGICITAFVAIAAWAPNVLAYTAPNTCADCHDWLTVSHLNHQSRTGCGTCHIDYGNPPTLVPTADSCALCHEPSPLQINHVESYGVASCGDCHFIPECTVDNDCDDNNACNGVETCDAGTCLEGTPPDCADGDLCTSDSCDPATGCVNVPVDCPAGEECNSADGQCYPIPDCTDDAQCDDGFFCNGAEICDAGTCVTGTPPDCDDGVNCTVDTCDEASDACVNTPDDASCDDGDVCTGTETCDPINDCLAGTPLDCDDGDLCTTDSCDALTGCSNVAVTCPAGEQCDSADGQCYPISGCTVDADCDDGFFCNGAEICDAGTCVSGTPPDCNDGIDCTVDTCDEASDACVNTPDDLSCPDDGLFCTGQEVCDSISGCVSTGDPCPEGTTCNEDTHTCDVVSKKVTICHMPSGNPAKAKTLRIGANAVAAHLRHGDFLGTCP